MRINVSAFLRLSETLRSETHVVEAAAEAEREAKQWSGASREEREERQDQTDLYLKWTCGGDFNTGSKPQTRPKPDLDTEIEDEQGNIIR